MRAGIAGVVLSFMLSALGVVTWSLTTGQDIPPEYDARPADWMPPEQPERQAGRDPAKLPPLGRQMFLSCQRGADWLVRANRPDGRFEYGFLPALRTQLEGDHYLRQVGAAFALARAARVTGDDRYAAVARQAILTLLLETTTSNVQGTKDVVRYTSLPSTVVNRLGSAGLLVLAIHELPKPAEDLLEQSDQLCRYIQQQQKPDGSLSLNDPAGQADAEEDGINYYPGEALYGLMKSRQHRPAEWKTQLVRKAVDYYLPWWRAHKNMAFVPWQTAAYAEAYLANPNEVIFAQAVHEMNDWVCDLQYAELDAKRPLWLGGFMGWADGKPVPVPPQIGSASFAESLADACRVAKQAGDVNRHRRYRESLERTLQFLVTLQYSDANTQHFADWYRPRLVGGFYASHQDGNLRIDYAQHAICALAQYVAYVAD
jgi:hypothetical protein